MVLLALSAGLGGQQARAQGVTPTPQQIEQFQTLSEEQRRQLLQLSAQSSTQTGAQTGASSQRQTGDTSVVPRDANNGRARFNLPPRAPSSDALRNQPPASQAGLVMPVQPDPGVEQALNADEDLTGQADLTDLTAPPAPRPPGHRAAGPA